MTILGRTVPGGGSRANLLRGVALAQGVFYTTTGIWPVLHIGSFQAVTGRKRDLWLVKTAGLLIASIGAALSAAALRGEVPAEVPLLGATSAASLASIDLVYASRRVIGPVYLLDALGEIGLVLAWTVASLSEDTREP
jgi:hypothetical protein